MFNETSVAIGDQILARSRAIVFDEQYELNDPTSWKKDEWNWLGHSVFSWDDVTDESLTLCTIITIVKFPDEANNLSHFLVLLPDGSIARIFDDYENGFWLEAESADPKVRKASTRVWMNRAIGDVELRGARRHPRARG